MKGKTHSPVAKPVAPVGESVQLGEALEAMAKGLLGLASYLKGQSSQEFHPVSLPSPSQDTTATVTQVINDFLMAKARAGRSDRYLRALRNSLCNFAKGRLYQPFACVTLNDIESWLSGSGWQARTQKGYLGDLKALYSFAVRRGYLAENLAARVESPTLIESAVGIHTPEQVAAILEMARGFDLSVMRCLAIRYFAGLRASEAETLEEKDIQTDRGVIEVTAVKSKTRRRRLVSITPTLAAWLGQGGELPLRSVSKTMRAFTCRVHAAGLPWPLNAPRHSFCSYHLAMWENAGKTALQAGHSETMLFHHYRAIVTQAQAQAFWAIRPR